MNFDISSDGKEILLGNDVYDSYKYNIFFV